MSPTSIARINAREILDSRGNPTVEVDVHLESGAMGYAAAVASKVSLCRYLGGNSARTLPVAMMNILDGGGHSDAPIDFQEFMIMRKGAPSFPEALRYGAEVFHALKSVLYDRGLSTAVGDEGGFAPKLNSAEDALDCIGLAVEKGGYKFGEQIFVALDPAASEFFDKEQNAYVFKKSDGSKRTASELVDYYETLANRFPIISIEDGCAENDWDGWKKLTARLGSKVQLVGDDLFVTNVEL